MDINLFTAAMRAEFIKSMQIVGDPAPYENLTTTVPSTARLENYAWMTPSPGVSQYIGRRRIAQLDSIKYTIQNLEYDATLSVPLRDVEDDQVGGYQLRMKELTVKAGKPFESRKTMQLIGQGGTNLCFDGTAFFATAHTIGGYPASVPSGFGGGGNAMTYSSSNTSDGVVSKFAILIHKPDQGLKPLIVQKRKAFEFFTDAGSQQSNFARKANYWIHGEEGFGYGYWWDGVQVTITNSPSLLDIFTCIDGCRQQLRKFYLPVALPTDPLEYVHEQTEFNAMNATIVCSTNLEQLFRHALNEDRVGVSVAGSTAGITSNIYYKSFGLITTNQMNP